MSAEMVLGGDGVTGSAVSTPGWRPSGPGRPRVSIAFCALMAFTFVLLVAPQNFAPSLGSLALAKVAIAYAVIAYVSNRITTERPFTVVAPPVKWAFVLAALAVLSTPASFWPGGSVDVLVNSLGKSLVVFLLIANVVDTPRRAKLLIGSMTAWGAVVAVFALQQYVTGGAPGARIEGYDSPLASNPNDLALTLNIVLGLALGLLPLLRRRVARVLLVGAIGLLLAGIVASFSRGGFLTLGAVGALWAARTLRERAALAIGSLALVVFVLAVALPEGYLNRLSTITDTTSDPTGSAEERWDTMTRAVGLIAERPLFGVGLGNGRHVSVARGGPDRETHNAYLKVGAELGVPGLVVYTLFVSSAWVTARAVRRRRGQIREHAELPVLAGGVELAVVAFAGGALFSPVPYHLYFFYPAGLAVALWAMARRPPAAPPATPDA